jgi:hypothetical protein
MKQENQQAKNFGQEVLNNISDSLQMDEEIIRMMRFLKALKRKS